MVPPLWSTGEGSFYGVRERDPVYRVAGRRSLYEVPEGDPLYKEAGVNPFHEVPQGVTSIQKLILLIGGTRCRYINKM